MGRSTGIMPYQHLPNAATIGEARKLLRKGLGAKGICCPLCRQVAKIYKRKLNSSMAFALVLIYRHFEVKDPGREGWLHVPKLLNGHGVVARGGDWSKLKHWGLIEERPGEREDGCKHAGEWRITKAGDDFARGVSTVPTYLYVYNQHPIAFPPEMTNIRNALGERFHYDELMSF